MLRDISPAHAKAAISEATRRERKSEASFSAETKIPEIGAVANDVVSAVLFDERSVNTKNCALDAAVAAVGEDVVAVIANIASAEIIGQRILVTLAIHCDPHVNVVLAHNLGQDEIELLLANLVHAFPASLRLALCNRGTGYEG